MLLLVLDFSFSTSSLGMPASQIAQELGVGAVGGEPLPHQPEHTLKSAGKPG